MKVVIGCDHGGFVLKDVVKKALTDLDIEYDDKGVFNTDSVDYPDYAVKVAKAVLSGDADAGILLCGTGIGISIAANKFKGIRCACVTDVFSATMAKEHNNANIIALGGRVTNADTAYAIVTSFMKAEFQGGRHQNRVDKITAIENGEL